MNTKILLTYPDYILYEDGRIFGNSTKKVFIKPSLTLDGYPQVNVKTSLARNGYRHSIKVHRLIAMAFVPNPDGHKEVNHIDGNKENNHYSNLEWCTRSHNLKHAFSLGLRTTVGARNATAKLKEWQVKAIRYLCRYCGYTQKRLAEFYGIEQATVSGIIRRKSWTHI